MAYDGKLHLCKEGHFFIESVCPWCGQAPSKEEEYREGDCVACGFLCPGSAYGCDGPRPIGSVASILKFLM